MSRLSDKAWLMREASRIAAALAETFAPLCEVVLHDLTDPQGAILQIANNLSGRSVVDSAPELGRARIADTDLPHVSGNCADQLAAAGPVKSTSIGLKDRSGRYIAAICVNIDISYLKSVSVYLNEFTKVQTTTPSVEEYLMERPLDVSARILAFSAARNRDPRALTRKEKSEILHELARDGELERRGAAEKIAAIIGVSRTNVYYHLKKRAQGGHATSAEEARRGDATAAEKARRGGAIAAEKAQRADATAAEKARRGGAIAAEKAPREGVAPAAASPAAPRKRVRAARFSTTES